MADLRKINLELDAYHLERLEGCGDELVLVMQAERRTRAGTPEQYKLRLKIYRCGVRELLQQFAKMHVRDRERIAQEAQRIEDERHILVRP